MLTQEIYTSMFDNDELWFIFAPGWGHLISDAALLDV